MDRSRGRPGRYSRIEEEKENTNTAKADISSKGDDGRSGVEPEVEILAPIVEKKKKNIKARHRTSQVWVL
ncbi:hypothetical protein ACOSP7_023358 [Xanthoceras sorbifolium]